MDLEDGTDLCLGHLSLLSQTGSLIDAPPSSRFVGGDRGVESLGVPPQSLHSGCLQFGEEPAHQELSKLPWLEPASSTSRPKKLR